MDYLNYQEMFSLRLNKNPATPLIHFALRRIVFGANSVRNLDRGLHRQTSLVPRHKILLVYSMKSF
jgi:hypothetical protein